MARFKAEVFCENNDCPNRGKVINTISGIKQKDFDLFTESWEPEDPADVCPSCGCDGVLDDSFIPE